MLDTLYQQAMWLGDETFSSYTRLLKWQDHTELLL